MDSGGGGGGGERAEEDLEIASIGSLYSGPWHKKYWSSSRGKDRYPYPIGYNAIRTYAGNIYRIEIHEGLRGPLFVVTCDDGDSGSGQTPDIALGNLLKKCGPRVKNWQGKRFSSKIDGVEFFGFRNPFVQRLFRELLANIGGKAESSLESPESCHGAMQTGSDILIHESRTYPDLLPYIGKKQSTGKRTMKAKYAAKSTNTASRSKRFRYRDIGNGSSYSNSKPGDELCSHVPNKSAMNLWTKEMSSTMDGSLVTVGNATTSTLVGLERQNNELTTGTSVKNAEENRDPGYSLAPVSLSVMVAGNCSAFQPESKLVKAVEPDFFVEKHVIFQEKRNFLRPGDSRPCSMEYKIHQADGIKLDRLLDAEVEERISLVAPEDSTEKILTLLRTSGVCVPDSLDTPKGSMDNIEESLCSMKDQHITDSPLLETSKSFFEVVTGGTPEDFINETQNCSSKCTNRMPEEVPDHAYSMPGDDLSKGLTIESLLDVNSSSGSSNASFGKTDLDSAGQELARSMMTFLLPRALPLLQKTYKRRSKKQNGKTKDRLAGENVENSHPTDISCQDKLATEMPVQRQGKNIQDMNIQPGNGSPYDITKVEYHTSTDMINQPFTERGNQKDVQSVVPDSFEDGSCACDVPRKRSSDYSFLKSNIQPSNVVKHNIDSSKLPANDTEQNKKSSYCQFGSSGCSRVVMMPDKLKRGIDITSGLPFVEVEPPYVKNNSNLHFEGERICDTEENINFSYMPRKNISRNDKKEHFGQCCAILELTSTHCRVDNIPKTCPPQSFGVSGSPVAKNHISSGQHLVNSVPANLDSRDANFPIQVDSVYNPQTELDAKVTGKGNSYSLVSMQETLNSTTGPSSDCLEAGKLLHPLASSIANNVPLSETIICRNFCNSNPPETYCALEINREDSEVRSTSEVVNNVANANGQRDVSETVDVSKTVASSPTSEVNLLAAAPSISEVKYVSQNVSKNMKSSSIIDPTVLFLEKNSLHDVNDFCNGEGHFNKAHYQDWCKASCDKNEDLAMEVFMCADKDNLTRPTIYDDCKKLSNTHVCRESHLNGSSNKEATCNNELKSRMELAGCYVHPGPVSSISLISKDDHLQICVECGHLECNFTYIFLYVIPLHLPEGANPSFIGYTSLVRGPLRSQNLFERSGLQFTPDARSLVFPSSIKAPCCRVQNVDCLCSNCKSDCFEENAIRIVHVEFGYISVIAKLTTTGTVTCILVSEPNFLIAAEKSGRLHVWLMDLTWSVSLEEFKLPSFDHILPVIIELKSVPKCRAMTIGHNGQGGFGLWDISKRVLLARFYTPGNTIFQMLPIGLFSRNNNFLLSTISKIEEYIKEVLLTDDRLFATGQNRSPLSSVEDIFVWLLVSSVFDSEAQDDHKMKEPKSGQVGWRLALAAKNMVIMGSSLDPRACAINTSADSGIIGTCDGDVYLWELATGKRLKKLHSFQGGVSCIAVDDKSGAVAAASDNGQLLVYLKQNCDLD